MHRYINQICEFSSVHRACARLRSRLRKLMLAYVVNTVQNAEFF